MNVLQPNKKTAIITLLTHGISQREIGRKVRVHYRASSSLMHLSSFARPVQFFADLDKLKQINDTFGHQEGDNAIVEGAAVLREVFRESDIIGRIGGDEFAVLTTNTTEETRELLTMRIHDILDAHNRFEGRNYHLSFSIGIAHYNSEATGSLDDLMVQADTLMYQEKKNKKC